MCSSRQSNKMYDTIDRFYEKEESKEIIRRLDPPRPSQSHLIASSKRGEETGSWFINCSEFSEWKSSPYSVLWLYGGGECMMQCLKVHTCGIANCFMVVQPDVARLFYGKTFISMLSIFLTKLK